MNAIVAFNDGRDCACAVVVTGTGRNTVGATIDKNLGTSLVDGVASRFGQPNPPPAP